MSDFDISKHEFSDEICINADVTNCNFVWFSTADLLRPLLYLEADDAIAIAKHFKLTAEDLE